MERAPEWTIASSDELIERWKLRGEEWRRLGTLVCGAAIADEIVADIKSLAEHAGGRLLTIAEAAQLSGYSVDHLRRLISDRKLRNAGRKGAPRLLASELPKRPSRPVASMAEKLYDPATDARFLRVRR